MAIQLCQSTRLGPRGPNRASLLMNPMYSIARTGSVLANPVHHDNLWLLTCGTDYSLSLLLHLYLTLTLTLTLTLLIQKLAISDICRHTPTDLALTVHV